MKYQTEIQRTAGIWKKYPQAFIDNHGSMQNLLYQT